MKKVLFILTILLPFAVLCQEGSTSDSKFAVGFSFSPDYSFRTLRSTDTMGDRILGYRDTTDLPKFGYTTGVRILYQFSKRFSFETGLLFSDKGDKTKPMSTFFPGYDDPLLWNVKSITINYHEYFIDIPLKINYKIIDRKLALFVSAGIAANIYLTTTNEIEILYKDGTTDKNRSKRRGESYRNISLSALIGFGVDYNFSKHSTARIEPTYRNSIISITNSSLHSYLYSIGVNCGVFYLF